MFRVGAEAELRVLAELQYSDPELVQVDLKQVQSVFSDLRLYCDFYCFPNKQKRRLLFLAGTIPVSYQGSEYNFPVCIWLHHTHPATRPRCCLCPSVSMVINPHCHYVDTHGNILSSRLHTWTKARSSLVLLISEMKQAFEKDTPLYARPLPPPQTTPPAGGGRSSSGPGPSPGPGTSPSPGTSPGPGSVKGPAWRSYCEDLKDIDFSPTHSPVHQNQSPALSDPAPSEPAQLLRAMTDLTLHATTSQSEPRGHDSSQSELRGHDSSQSEPRGHDSSQSELRGHDSSQSEPRGHDSSQSELRGHDSCQSELRGHDSSQSELRGHDSSQSEPHLNHRPLLRISSEEQEEMSQLPPHRLQMFLQLLQSQGQGYSTGELLEAVRLNEDLPSAQRFLHHLCPVCQEHVSFSKMVLMTHCACSLCESCFKSWFSSVIREKSVEQFVCPLCAKPDLKDQDLDLDMDYFNLLDTQIRHFLSPELHDLFQRKLRDRALVHMRHFCWCSHCSFGVVHESGSLKMDCPSCNKSTCSRCRSPWSSGHQGVSCEEFRVQTKTRTGPLFNCIECPDCGEIFSGSRGGCLHFSCLRCGTQFCGGCSRRFVHGQACGFAVSCSSRGLHAHHPRDCVYHLRDWSVHRLHLLLQFYRGSPTWIEPANWSADHAYSSGACPELRDAEEPCAKPAVHRGYCRSHYVERLVHLLNVLGADPVVLFSVEELETELRRWNHPLPPQPDPLYHARLTQMVLQKVPLKTRSGPGAAVWTMVSAPPPPEPGLNQD